MTVANQRLNRALLFGLFSDQMSQLKTDLVSIELWESADFQPQSLTVTEPFMIWMKAGLISGLILALPVVMYFLWCFVAEGLYPHEKKYVHIFPANQHPAFYRRRDAGVLFRVRTRAGLPVFVQPADGNRSADANQRLAKFRHVPATWIRRRVSTSVSNVVHEPHQFILR